MILDLLDQEDFESFPEEAGPRWAALEGLARHRLKRAIDAEKERGRSEKQLLLQYMHLVASAADELGVQGVSVPGGSEPTNQIDSFMVNAQAAATRIWLRSSGPETKFGFKLNEDAKATIRNLVAKIQGNIPELGLTSRQEQRLKQALLSFSTELEMPKSRFSIGSGHLVAALTILNLGVTTTAAGPDAIHAIKQVQSIWGEEHERVESARLGIPYAPPVDLLPPPQKMIAGPKTVQNDEP